ncbi:hypothetical protein [Microbispora hainanensis]|uniref:Uncharacterized protein n=1 Tax=Microbispora hainanensis TaxID=568844 RepID=A0A544YX58_9ACTN|nr:hypothetical protein [Microbispora hainanensis]TQS21341.1 hypothetical protein FLX08_12830 [Microbispora hainanensis]
MRAAVTAFAAWSTQMPGVSRKTRSTPSKAGASVEGSSRSPGTRSALAGKPAARAGARTMATRMSATGLLVRRRDVTAGSCGSG